MATLIEMRCSDCSYLTNTLQFGPKMIDRTMIVPALDIEAKEIVEADMEEGQSDKLVFYTNKKLKGSIKRKKIPADIMAYDHSMQIQNNFCPKCNGFTLQVEVVGLSD
jgi:hypothetical protein